MLSAVFEQDGRPEAKARALRHLRTHQRAMKDATFAESEAQENKEHMVENG